MQRTAWLHCCLVIPLVVLITVGCQQPTGDPQPKMSDGAGDDESEVVADGSNGGREELPQLEDILPGQQLPVGDTPTPPAGEVAAKMTPKEYRAALAEDEDKFNQEYTGRQIEVTGTVFDIWVQRVGFSGPVQPSIVMCSLTDDSRPFDGVNVNTSSFVYCSTPGTLPWQRLRPGSEATLRGTYNGEGRLTDGAIVESTGDPVPAMMASALAKAYQDDPEGTSNKYGDLSQRILLTAVVDRLAEDGNEAPILKSDAGIDMKLTLADASQFDDVKPGDELTVLANCIFLGLDEPFPISLGDCQRCDKVMGEAK